MKIHLVIWVLCIGIACAVMDASAQVRISSECIGMEDGSIVCHDDCDDPQREWVCEDTYPAPEWVEDEGQNCIWTEDGQRWCVEY